VGTLVEPSNDAHDDALASLLFLAGEQVPNRYYYEYEPRDEPMPVAVVIGAEPAVQCSTEMWIPTGGARRLSRAA